MNQATSYIDASFLYGVDDESMNKLRLHKKGKYLDNAGVRVGIRIKNEEFTAGLNDDNAFIAVLTILAAVVLLNTIQRQTVDEGLDEGYQKSLIIKILAL